MVDIERYLFILIERLTACFGSRLLYIGLQGSYLRGEATEESDIDIMTVIDGLSVSDLDAYRAAVKSIQPVDKSCGFICSKADLASWNPLEICHLLHSTKDYYGSLRELIPEYSQQDIINFAKISVNNLYHEICHRHIHGGLERREPGIQNAYKAVFFILQNLYYLRSGTYVSNKIELLSLLCGKDHAVLDRLMAIQQGEKFTYENNFEMLFTWCQETLHSIA